jgi:BlaI family transcriptional regulator, penicillinase repressor
LEKAVPRPKSAQPTPGELEVLKILWQCEPMTVRQVMEELNKHHRRAYTSVMSLMEVMNEKGFLIRSKKGRAFVYQANVSREKTVGKMLMDLMGRAFEDSASALMVHLLDQTNPSTQELEEIRRTIDEYCIKRGDM